MNLKITPKYKSMLEFKRFIAKSTFLMNFKSVMNTKLEAN